MYSLHWWPRLHYGNLVLSLSSILLSHFSAFQPHRAIYQSPHSHFHQFGYVPIHLIRCLDAPGVFWYYVQLEFAGSILIGASSYPLTVYSSVYAICPCVLTTKHNLLILFFKLVYFYEWPFEHRKYATVNFCSTHICLTFYFFPLCTPFCRWIFHHFRIWCFLAIECVTDFTIFEKKTIAFPCWAILSLSFLFSLS